MSHAPKPKLSVLLVTFNHENYIRQALDSVIMQQTDFDFEIVVADDNSSDSTKAVIEAYQAGNQNIRILPSEQNVGITRNYQRGFAACRGEYIAVLEGDDFWISPTKVKASVAFLEQHKECAFCFHRYLMHDAAANHFSVRPAFEMETEFAFFTAAQLARDNLVGNFSVCTYRRALIDQLDPALWEMTVYDWMLNITVSERRPIGYLPAIMSVYRVHSAGVWSGKSPSENLPELLKLIDDYNEYLDFRFDSEFQAFKTSVSAD